MNTTTPSTPQAASDTLLDHMRYQADPLADAAIASILGTWEQPSESAPVLQLLSANATQWERLATVSRVFAQWDSNRSVEHWTPAGPDMEPQVAQPLEDYLRTARELPQWACRDKIAQAEEIFFDYGVLSCTLLFCASLPECYVVPDLAEVLHVTGQLEQRTEYRIRSTAAMIFPVMMKGGLTDPDGGGVAQVLKVRLIHATIRHLILRGSPEQAMFALAGQEKVAGAGVVPPLTALRGSTDMHQALYAHGWKLGEDGLPCNQEELAYTLLTFGYVFLRGLRTLGLGLGREKEQAYIHAWNVVGHLVGVQRELMADTMEDAEKLFATMQARGRASLVTPDPRPELGRALMQTMEQIIPLRLAKPFPSLLTRYLCGRQAARDLGITGRASWLSRLLFALCMLIIRGIDALVRLVVPDFSISRFITRVVGHQFMTKVLMDQTRPLKLPEHLLNRAHNMMSGWGNDPKAPRWLNALEGRFTNRGGREAPARQ